MAAGPPAAIFLCIFQNKGKGSADGLIAHRFPVTGEMIFSGKGAMCIGIADEYCANRITECIAIGAGQAGNRNGNIRLQFLPGPYSHSLCHRRGNRAKSGKIRTRNTQHFPFDRIRIADDTAFIDPGRTGHCRARLWSRQKASPAAESARC